MENVIDVLRERGLIEQITNEAVRDVVSRPVKVYCGFDPTADSLHLGNMVAIMGLAWFQRLGHTPVAIIGGATGMIGDPSGKSSERNLLDEEAVRKNAIAIQNDIQRVISSDKFPAPLFLNNLDWFQKFSFIEFLRDVGKHFRVGVMMSKESVRERLKSEEGMSFTEFSYQLLQGYDFYHLFHHYGVSVQLGGSDQWGNITAGMDLIKRLTGKESYGITLPLLTKSDGQKFGKSEKGALWMNPEKLSSYELYQQLIRIEDADVINLLKRLTFVDIHEIRHLEHRMKLDDYVPNTAQKLLASEVVALIHGQDGLVKALSATEGMRPGKETELDASVIRSLLDHVSSKQLPAAEVVGKKLIDIVVLAGFLPSKSEARRLVKNGGMYLNNKKVDSEEYVVTSEELLENQFLLFAFGKKNKAIVEVS